LVLLGINKESKITREIILNYLEDLRPNLQMIINRVYKPDGIKSCKQFRYYWGNAVALVYYKRVQEKLGNSN